MMRCSFLWQLGLHCLLLFYFKTLGINGLIKAVCKIWYHSHLQAAKAQTICAVWPEPLLLVHTKNGCMLPRWGGGGGGVL